MFEQLPSFKTSRVLGGKAGSEDAINANLWDVAFYPFAAADSEVDAVFAVTGGTSTLVCRVRSTSTGSDTVEELLRFRDSDDDASLNSLAWAQIQTGDPLLCVTGALPTIKVFNITTRNLVQTLAGHGAPINNLAVPKTNPSLLASASEDHTIRIWSLDPTHAQQPCAAIFAGGGHRAPLNAIDFHLRGKYLLSGGMDTFINLWAVPSLPTVKANTGTPNPTVTQISTPPFTTAEPHANKIDTLKFHDDLILSSAAMSPTILLWRIKGFNSSHPPPTPASIAPRVTTTSETWSVFGDGWEPLMTFAVPDTEELWFRFDLFAAAGRAPVLAAGNCKGKVFFWDLERLEVGVLGVKRSGRGGAGGGRKGKKRKTMPSGAGMLGRAGSVLSSRAESNEWSSPATGSGGGAGAGEAADVQGVKTFGGPFREQPPHKTVKLGHASFYGLQAAWSVDGQWCVLCGSAAEVMVCKRDEFVAS